jgi:tRNA (cytosine49-C5)-methyltransferase
MTKPLSEVTSQSASAQSMLDSQRNVPLAFPDKDKYEFKPDFVKRYHYLLGDRYQSFIDYSLSFKRRCIRVNTLKTTTAQVLSRLSPSWNLTPVGWYADAFWIEHKGIGDEQRRDVGNLLEHQLGYIYIQDPASMIPPLVLVPTADDIVLDVCAAPGSKTTQMAQMMQNKGIIVANELSGDRIASLGMNIERCGAYNVLITQCDATKLRFDGKFTKILLDAPCSGTGTIRKSPKTIREWNPSQIVRLAKTNLRLLEHVWSLLAVGGRLVYSTCTLEPHENEGVIDSFIRAHADVKVCSITLPLVRSQPVLSFEGIDFDPRVKDCLRIYPQDNDTEGFFVTLLEKTH